MYVYIYKMLHFADIRNHKIHSLQTQNCFLSNE